MTSEPISTLTLQKGRRRYRVKTDSTPGPNGRRRQVVATFDRLADAALRLIRFVGRFDVAPFAAEVTAPDDAHAGVARKPAFDAFDAFEPVLRPRW